MQIPKSWPQPDPGGGWKLRNAWWKELPPVWQVRFVAAGLPTDWIEARKLTGARY